MSIPPPPQHPPPRRQPHEPEDPSLTTQIFLDQARTAAAGRGSDTEGGSEDGAGSRSGRAPVDDAHTQALTPQGIAEARRLAAESGTEPGGAASREAHADQGGESTRVLSMDELREIAASSRVEAIDGPREALPRAQPSPRASAQDEARAREQAAPGVFSTSAPPPQAPTFAVPPPVVPPAPPAVHPHGAPQMTPQGVPPSTPHGASPSSPYASPSASAHPAGIGQYPYTGHASSTAAGTGHAQRKQRRMPVLAILFVVLSGLIVLGIGGWIVVDMLSRSDDGAQQTAPPPPATQDSTGEGTLVDEADDESTQPATGDVESFVTPTGNIGCTIDSERARCIVQSFDYDPPDAPDGCTMDDWGSIVVANSDGAGFSCTPADFPSDAQPLDYGQSVSAHGMTCASSETGVSCRSDETGAAFSVARASASFDQP